MLRIPISTGLIPFGCVWLFSFTGASALAQLSISVGDQGVQVQNGNAPPLIVPPGKSFGGTLTTNGFAGVMSGPDGQRKMLRPVENPFRAAGSPATDSRRLSVSLSPPSRSKSPPSAATLRDLMRSSDLATARKQMERMLREVGPNAELLQCQAVLLLRMHDELAAAACVYDALAMDAVHANPLPLLTDAMMADVERQLRSMARDNPSLKTDFLLAWWDYSRGNRADSLTALRLAMKVRPSDPLFMRLMDEWSRVAPQH